MLLWAVASMYVIASHYKRRGLSIESSFMQPFANHFLNHLNAKEWLKLLALALAAVGLVAFGATIGEG
ncbi:hypothetical protein BWI17_00685 [Betaproteobacteria bacterium GR16-43]|nr:hypothetical protein BWI17_00685 [Betaproteobacteria bacterium GR16-43]